MNLLWGNQTWEDVAEAARSGALIVAPFGSVEQHGPMLPVDTDVRIAEKMAADGAQAALDKFGVRSLVLPTMPFGLALHHMSFAGTISLQPETYLAVVTDVLRCVLGHGFRKIAVITGHGGNTAGLELAMEKVVERQQVERQQAVRLAFFRGAQ